MHALHFVEQVREFHGVAAPGFKGLAVLAEDTAKPAVRELHRAFRVEPPPDGEELPEVELLPAIGDVNDFVGRKFADAVGDGREVCGGVV